MTSRYRLLLALTTAAALAPALAPVPAYAQTAETKITMTAASYSLYWNGTSGTLRTESFAGKPAEEAKIQYLFTSAGPEGYAKNLVWFLARSGDKFTILWCYMNESGKDFWCYLYQYPDNALTTHNFKGDYRFTPPKETNLPAQDLLLRPAPLYIGPEFTYSNYTGKTGTISTLNLAVAKGELKGTPATDATTKPDIVLTNLRVSPLHEVSVGGQNGWRKEGWRELHSLAYDEAAHPYYLIQYSNTARGYVLDLDTAKLYTTDFTTPVTFSAQPVAIGTTPDRTLLPQTPRAARYEILDLAFSTDKNATSMPSTFYAEVKAPDGKTLNVPGYWAGAKKYGIRLAPNRIGVWSYATHSANPDLNGRTGTFECLPDESSVRGYLVVNPSVLAPHQFSYSDGTNFFPVSVASPVLTMTPEERAAAAQDAALKDKPALPTSFSLFRKRMEALAKQGVNRLTGDYIFDGELPENEGGSLFRVASGNLLRPAYFEWLDRRIEVCRTLGIVPDIGVGNPSTTLFASIEPDTRTRIWTEFLARYAAHNVAYTLFKSDKPLPPLDTRALIAEYGALTQRYNPLDHPISTLATTLPAPPVEPIPGRYVVRKRKPGEFKEGNKPAPASVFADATWQDFITQEPGTLEAATRNYALNKPVMVMTSATDEASQVREMWRITMKGAYPLDPTPVLDSAPTLSIGRLTHDKLLRSTRYSRLDPHADLLTEERKPSSAMNTGVSSLVVKPTIPYAVSPTQTVPFVLADPAWEYLVYFEGGGKATLDLLEATGKIRVRWTNTQTGLQTAEETMEGGGRLTFTTPSAEDWVLVISRR